MLNFTPFPKVLELLGVLDNTVSRSASLDVRSCTGGMQDPPAIFKVSLQLGVC